MSIRPDSWIRRMAGQHGMIEPFEPGQVRAVNGARVISFGTSSYGYDVRCARQFKVFTNINSTIVDPKAFDPNSFVDMDTDVCIIPPNSFALASTVEYFRIPRNVLTVCLGKSTYARCGIIVKGLDTCRAAALVSGGGKSCTWGCLGLGDCERVCDFKAIHMDRNGLPVVTENKCTACGDCVEVCPKSLFSIHEVSHRLWVACKNQLNGDDAEFACEVACTACGRCAADAPALIQMVNNLAVVDYSKNHLATIKPIQRCPTGAIVWIDEKKGFTKGLDAKKITRKSPLPVEPADLPVSR